MQEFGLNLKSLVLNVSSFIFKKLKINHQNIILSISEKVGAWVLFISTDYVFDGKNPPYNEDAIPNPLNKYGISKLEGEQATLIASQSKYFG